MCFEAKKVCQNVTREAAAKENIDWQKCRTTLAQCKNRQPVEKSCHAHHYECDGSYPLPAQCSNAFRMAGFIREGTIVEKKFNKDDSCSIVYQVRGPRIRALYEAAIGSTGKKVKKIEAVEIKEKKEKEIIKIPATKEEEDDLFRDDIDQTP